jgi:hypothetical protein
MPDTPAGLFVPVCGNCTHWRVPVSENRKVCVLFGEATSVNSDCEYHSEWLPFTDGPEVDDDVARRELRGEGL